MTSTKSTLVGVGVGLAFAVWFGVALVVLILGIV